MEYGKIAHINISENYTNMTVLISDMMYFRTKDIKKDKEGHFIMIKVVIPSREYNSPKACAPNNRASKYLKNK